MRQHCQGCQLFPVLSCHSLLEGKMVQWLCRADVSRELNCVKSGSNLADDGGRRKRCRLEKPQLPLRADVNTNLKEDGWSTDVISSPRQIRVTPTTHSDAVGLAAIASSRQDGDTPGWQIMPCDMIAAASEGYKNYIVINSCPVVTPVISDLNSSLQKDSIDRHGIEYLVEQNNFAPSSPLVYVEQNAVTPCDKIAQMNKNMNYVDLVAPADKVDYIVINSSPDYDAETMNSSPVDGDAQDTSYLPGLDDSVALRCLAFLPWTEHWRLSLLSRRHRDLVQEGLLLKIREQYDMTQQWICIYTSGNNGWTCYDPYNNSWRNLPHANVDPDFDLSDKESLSAGSHLLWLGREIFNFACYKYDLGLDSWERGPAMVNPRCLFASATCGAFAFVAGGFSVGGAQFNVLNTAERYNSLRGIWEPLPSMSTPRHKCSGFFMDGKFYVIGGKSANHEPLTSGEEYDPEKNLWRTIENMYSYPDSVSTFEPSPPLVAVAGNELYAIESSSNLLKVYDKYRNTWRILGRVPVRADFCNGWGLAFKALGDELFVIGGHQTSAEEREGVAVFSWRPQPDASSPEWKLLNSRVRGTGNFLFNCAVMIRP